MNKRQIGQACMRAADRIMVPGQWCRWDDACRPDGEPVSPLALSACKWSASGALLLELDEGAAGAATLAWVDRLRSRLRIDIATSPRVSSVLADVVVRDDTIAEINDAFSRPAPAAALLREIGRRLIDEADAETPGDED